MSAYSASPPVTQSTTAPSDNQASAPCWRKKRTAQSGFSAARTAGFRAIPAAPVAPIARNHTSVIGPNNRPTPATPRFWIENRTSSTTIVAGRTKCARPGATTPSPSTADSTEIAGVSTPSPKNSAVPKMPRIPTAYESGAAIGRLFCTTAMSARMPPSPRLSARMMIATYLIVTTISSDQNTSDNTPSTLPLLGARP